MTPTDPIPPAAAPIPARQRGACPGALVPMRVADGLLVRLRRADATLTPAQAGGLAVAARRHGNGLIDLSQRANLQLRGVRDDTLAPLTHDLRALGLVDDAPAGAERIRNVLTSPTCGLDPACAPVRPPARVLDAALALTPALWRLPAKFGFLLNGGGALPLDGCPADIRFDALGDGSFAAAVGGTRDQALILGTCGADALVPAALALAAVAAQAVGQADRTAEAAPPARLLRRMRDLRHDPAIVAALRAALAPFTAPPGHPRKREDPTPPAPGPAPLRAALGRHRHDANANWDNANWANANWSGAGWVGVAFPFGGLDAAALAALAELGRPLRLTPWRALLVEGWGDADTLRRLERIGGILSADDPRLLLAACSGRGACDSGIADARTDARALLAAMESHCPQRLAALRASGGVIHVSGCAKGCAHPDPAALTLTATAPGRYDLGIDQPAGASPPVAAGLGPEEVAALLATVSLPAPLPPPRPPRPLR